MDGTTFSYQADPRPIQERPRYREDMEPTKQYCNIVVDPRIARGITYARRNLFAEKLEKIPSYQTAHKVKTKKVVPIYELPRDGFSFGEVQTDPFDENAIEIIKKEATVSIQTDPYNEPVFVHRKPPPLVAVGVKTSTPGNDLFDFEREVMPFVVTLVQKALAEAHMEVSEEQELANMARYLRAYQKTEEKEKERIAKMEEIEAQKFAEKEQIVAERLAIEESQFEVRSKILSRGFAEFFTWDIADDVIKELENRNYFYDEVERSIDETYIPWLFQRVGEEFVKDLIPDALYFRAQKNACQQVEDKIVMVGQCTEDKLKTADEIRLEQLRRMIGERRVALAMKEKKAILAKKSEEKKASIEEEEEQVEAVEEDAD